MKLSILKLANCVSTQSCCKVLVGITGRKAGAKKLDVQRKDAPLLCLRAPTQFSS